MRKLGVNISLCPGEASGILECSEEGQPCQPSFFVLVVGLEWKPMLLC